MATGFDTFIRRERELLSFSPVSPEFVSAQLIGAVQSLSLARSLLEIQKIVRHAARQLTGADGATFLLLDGDYCHYADEDAISPLWKGQRIPAAECIGGWTMRHRQAVAIEDIYNDDRIPQDVYRPTFVRSLAMVPIRQLDPLGAIGNYWAEQHRATDQELALLQALADTTAVALENVRIYQALNEARMETLSRLALAAEYRDDDTFEHTDRVARSAALLAAQAGLPPLEVDLLRQAAPLHDLGKLAVSDTILRKPGSLTDEEMAEVRRHPEAGAAILTGGRSRVLKLAEEIALTHHEWWDGSGYPRQLAGEEIPISGRIVAIADVFDALSHARPYKPAWSLEAAVAEMRSLSGRQFDPELIDVFMALEHSQLINLAVDA